MRIQTLFGKEPFLIVAPHGFATDDENTDIVSRTMAKELDGFAVINTGWQRIAGKPDYEHNRANLNNLKHCMTEPVYGEFIQPIIAFRDRILAKHGVCYMYLIHGMSAKVQERAKDDVQVVIGYGQGKPPKYSCTVEHKDRFVHCLRMYGLNVYQGKSGGRFSAWRKSNTNQLFVRRYPTPQVQSMQIELISGLRKHPDTAKDAGRALAGAANRASWRLDPLPGDFRVCEY